MLLMLLMPADARGCPRMLASSLLLLPCCRCFPGCCCCSSFDGLARCAGCWGPLPAMERGWSPGPCWCPAGVLPLLPWLVLAALPCPALAQGSEWMDQWLAVLRRVLASTLCIRLSPCSPCAPCAPCPPCPFSRFPSFPVFSTFPAVSTPSPGSSVPRPAPLAHFPNPASVPFSIFPFSISEKACLAP